MARQASAYRAAERAGVVLQPLGELFDGQDLGARGGELERQWDAVDTEADTRDRFGVGLVRTND